MGYFVMKLGGNAGEVFTNSVRKGLRAERHFCVYVTCTGCFGGEIDLIN